MSHLNEVFGDPRSLCGWSVGNGEVRLQTRDPRFRVAIYNLNRDQAPSLRPRPTAVGSNVYLRVYAVQMEPRKARAFVLRQLERNGAPRPNAAR